MSRGAPKAAPKASRVDAMREERERQANEREAQAAEAKKRMAKEAKPETDGQRAERLHAVVKSGAKGFTAMLAALMELKADKLYLKWAPTFELYCGKHLGITARRANQLITAGETAAEMGSTLPIETSTRVVEELAKVEPAERPAVLQEASSSGKPTAAKVKQAVEKRKPAPEPPSPIVALLVTMRRLEVQLRELAPESAAKLGTPHEASELTTKVAQLGDWCRRYRP